MASRMFYPWASKRQAKPLSKLPDPVFVEEVPDKYRCSICTTVLDTPVLTECCGQHFCKACLEKWLIGKRVPTCPHCRATGKKFKSIVSQPLLREINELKVYCNNQSKGCTEIMTYKALSAHLDICPFGMVECSKHCGAMLKRKDVAQHQKDQCPNRNVRCDLCNKEGMYCEIVSTHIKICQEVALNCPNNCGVIRIKRKNLDSHRETCKLERIKCQFCEVGCIAELSREAMNIHEVSDLQQHLVLTMRASKQKCEKIQNQHDELQMRLDTIVSVVSTELGCLTGASMHQLSVSIECMKTALQSLSSTMLVPSQTSTYTLHFTVQNGILRSPFFYVYPGYRMYLQYIEFKQSVIFVLMLERSERDKMLPWPIPNNMSIQIRSAKAQQAQPYKRYYGAPSGASVGETQLSKPLCTVCSKSADLEGLAFGQQKKQIMIIEDKHRPIEKGNFYAKITITEHMCPRY